MSTTTEVIIIATPFVFGLTLWLANELFQGFKVDLKDLKKSTHTILKRQERHEVKIDNHEMKTAQVIRSIDAIKITVHEIDKRTGDTVELTRSMKDLQAKLNTHEANYGKIMIILKRVVTIVTGKGTDKAG